MPSPMMLNLDDLTADAKVVTLNHQDHTAVEMTVEGYVERLKQAKIVKEMDDTVENRVEQSVVFIASMFPTIPIETLRTMPLRKLTALITFAMATPEDLAAAAATPVVPGAEPVVGTDAPNA